MIRSQGVVTVSGLTLLHSLGDQTPSGTEVSIWGKELAENFNKACTLLSGLGRLESTPPWALGSPGLLDVGLC